MRAGSQCPHPEDSRGACRLQLLRSAPKRDGCTCGCLASRQSRGLCCLRIVPVVWPRGSLPGRRCRAPSSCLGKADGSLRWHKVRKDCCSSGGLSAGFRLMSQDDEVLSVPSGICRPEESGWNFSTFSLCEPPLNGGCDSWLSVLLMCMTHRWGIQLLSCVYGGRGGRHLGAPRNTGPVSHS